MPKVTVLGAGRAEIRNHTDGTLQAAPTLCYLHSLILHPDSFKTSGKGRESGGEGECLSPETVPLCVLIALGWPQLPL